MTASFKSCGKIMKAHEALTLDVAGWNLGQLVIAGGDVPVLMAGGEVDIYFVQQRPGREPFIGTAGRARPSRSGQAITFWIESRMCTVPRKALENVLSGRVLAARVSTPAPIIDADEVQRKPIDHDLPRCF